MHEKLIKPGAPFTLTLSADARLTPIDFFNDQIWNLMINRGEPPGLVLETTYGLRARSQRLFPRFTEGDTSVTSPVEYPSPVIIHEYYPNLVKLSFTPLVGIQASLDYWVVSSQVVAGQIILHNTTKKKRQVRLEWIGLLVPNPNGQRMAAEEISNVNILHGHTDMLEPVLFVAGGAHPSNGSYTSLVIEIELPAGSQRSTVCTLASLNDKFSSFELARATACRNWSAETSRIAMINASQIQVVTGNPVWNEIFDITQTITSGLLIRSDENLNSTSFVLTRQPDNGFSIRGDGSDYNNQWNAQTALQALFFSQVLLPQYPSLGREFLENFLANQSADGFIDWKPGATNQRTALAATPVLCDLAWFVYEHIRDTTFLTGIYPKLLKFANYWFEPQMDRDLDGIPEWTHVFQTGFEDNPLFSYWTPGSKGIHISTVESPDLCAMLYNEIQALIRIAEIVGDFAYIPDLVEKARLLKDAVDTTWDADTHCYSYRDRDGHTTQNSQVLAVEQQTGNISIQQSFNEPVRLIFQIRRTSDSTRRFVIFIHGTNPTGGHRVERIEPEQFDWHLEKGYTTSGKIYSHIEKVVIEGLRQDDYLVIRTVGLAELDQTLLLPIWAGAAKPERVQNMIDNLFTDPNLFGNIFGIPTFPGPNSSTQAEIHIPYNSMVLRGLLQYGYRVEAGEIMTRLMNLLSGNYQREGAFRRAYDAHNGQGKGELNALEGLAPLSTFLEILGIHIYSPWKFQIQGFNPFPWPVTVKYCGTSILRQKEKTTIVFTDGQTVTFDDAAPHLISLE